MYKHTVSHQVQGKLVEVYSETLESREPQQRIVDLLDNAARTTFERANGVEGGSAFTAIAYKVDDSLEHYVHRGFFLDQYN